MHFMGKILFMWIWFKKISSPRHLQRQEFKQPELYEESKQYCTLSNTAKPYLCIGKESRFPIFFMWKISSEYWLSSHSRILFEIDF